MDQAHQTNNEMDLQISPSSHSFFGTSTGKQYRCMANILQIQPLHDGELLTNKQKTQTINFYKKRLDYFDEILFGPR